MNMKLKITMQFYLNIILKIGYKQFNQIFSTLKLKPENN